MPVAMPVAHDLSVVASKTRPRDAFAGNDCASASDDDASTFSCDAMPSVNVR
jgi:hypothetical protein